MTELQLKGLINKHVDSVCIMTLIKIFSSIPNHISSNYIMSYRMGQDVNLPLFHCEFVLILLILIHILFDMK